MEGLQSAHGSHEGVREVVAADREGVPTRRVEAAFGVFGGVWFARGIVEVDAHRRAVIELRKDVDKLRGGYGHIEEGIRWSEAHGFGDGSERTSS